jgi:hypothetical protein
MKPLIFVFLLLAVAGCASPGPVSQKPTDPIFVPTPVSVPVREVCQVEAVPEPAWAVDQVALDASAFEKSKAILAEIEQRRDYENQLKAAARKCE